MKRQTLTRFDTRTAASLLCAAFLISGLALPGCGSKDEWDQFWHSMQKDKGSQPTADTRPNPNIKALQGTIGSVVTLEGMQNTQVRGYGLVVGLVDTGGKDGPVAVKSYLQKEIRRRTEVGARGASVEEILSSPDSAMVDVIGNIPPAAKKGDRFDIAVSKLGQQTKSLVGGRLVLCNLSLWAETPKGIIEGKMLAMGAGPVFVSPFDPEGRATSKIDLKYGAVLGGGEVKEPRRIRLILNDPSYSLAQQIMNRINSRWTAIDPIANAQSPSAIELKIPDQYPRERRMHFLNQVMHTTINANPALLEKRTQDLVSEVAAADADLDAIGLAWEAIGRSVLPQIRDLYKDKLPAVAYFAGRTGMRLGDNAGMEAVARYAMNPDSQFREAAIEELGFATSMHGAGESLRKLLDDPDSAIRIQAYQALRHHKHPAIHSEVLDLDNFVLDVVDSNGPYLIYVQRIGQPCIALFGKQMRCNPPAIFPAEKHERRLLTQISAGVGARELEIIYKNKETGQHSPKIDAPLEVAALVRLLGGRFQTDANNKVEGLAVPYSEVVDMLSAFCKVETIPAKFVVEEQTATDQAPGDQGRQREESEY